MGAILYSLCALFDLLLSSVLLVAPLAILCLFIILVCFMLFLSYLLIQEGLFVLSIGVGFLSLCDGLWLLLAGCVYAVIAAGLALSLTFLVIDEFNNWLFQPLNALIGGIMSVLLAPIFGAQAGWLYGIDGVVQTVLDYIQRTNLFMRAEELRNAPYLLFSNLVTPRFLTPLAPHEAILEAYTLTLASWNVLRNAPRGLTVEEQRACEELRQNKPELERLYGRYLERFDFINPTRGCPILVDGVTLTANRAPDEQDPRDNHKAMLLVKQFLGPDGQWHAVPTQSFLFSESALILILEHNRNEARAPNHPITQESLTNPNLFNGHQTRFIIHPLFDDAVQPLISQELNELANQIRQNLRDAVPVVDARAVMGL